MAPSSPALAALLAVLLLAAAAAAPALALGAAADAPAPAPVPAPAQSSSSSPSSVASLFLIATNDVHNRVDEVDPLDGGACTPAKKGRGVCAGGFARLATFFKLWRQRAANQGAAALVVDAGDQTTGSAWDVVFRQGETAGLMAQAGYNVTTLGNHEFDFDLSTLANLTAEAASQGVPFLGACSVPSFGSGSSGRSPSAAALLNATVKRHLVREVVASSGSQKALLKVGFIGYVVSSTARTQAAARNVSFVPDADAAALCARELRQAHPDLDAVVALSHLGYQADLALAPQLLGLVDVVIGGHSHTFLASGNSAPIWDLNATAVSAAAGGAGGGGGTKKEAVDASTCAAAGACDAPEGPYPAVFVKEGKSDASLPQQPPPPQQRLTIVHARFASIYASVLRLDFALPPPLPSASSSSSSSPLGRRGGRGSDSNIPLVRPTRLISVQSATGGAPALLGGPASTNPVEQDQGMLAYIAARRGPVDALASAPVGRALPPGGLALGDARRAESPLASYLCDAMLHEAAAANDTSSSASSSASSPDACFIGAGALRQGIPPGPVTRADVAAAHPYGNSLALARVTAAQLVEAAQHGLKGVSVQSGRFPQVAGLRLYVDYGNTTTGGNPAFVGLYLLPPVPGQGAGNGYRAALAAEDKARGGGAAQAVSPADRARLGVRLQPGDNATTLVLASSDYILGGGDGYAMLEANNPGGGKAGRLQVGGRGGPAPAPVLLADVLARAIARDTASAAGGARASAPDPLNPRVVDCVAARKEGRCKFGGDVVYRPCCEGP